MYHNLPQTPGVYAITCTANGKCYVGQSQDMRRRVRHHYHKLRSRTHDNPLLQRLYNRYGVDAFTVTVLEHVQDLALLDERETYWIAAVGTINFLQVAATRRGVPMSEATKRKIGRANKGKRPSIIERLQRSQVRRGIRCSPEGREAQRRGMIGHAVSDKTREKLRRQGRRRWAQTDIGKRMAQGRIGSHRSFSDHHREALSQALKGRTITPEWRQKLAQRAREQWARKRAAEIEASSPEKLPQ